MLILIQTVLVKEDDFLGNKLIRQDLDAPWGATGDVTTLRNTTSLDQQRAGSQSTITEVINNETLGDRVVSRELVHFIRSRNIEVTAKRLKPFTQVYPFFDGVDVSNFTFNKLVRSSDG